MPDETVKDYENKLVELRHKGDNLKHFIQKRRDDILKAKIDIEKAQTGHDDNIKHQIHLEKLLRKLIGDGIKDRIIDAVKE